MTGTGHTRTAPALRGLLTVLAAVTVMLLTSCGSDSFKVKCDIAGGRTMNVRVVYAGDDVLNNVLGAARDGRFLFEGHAPENGALVEILDNDYRPLGRFFARNGDEIKLTVDPANPAVVRAEGSDVNERWSEWTAKNAKVLQSADSRAVNAAVAAYVKGHKDDILSSLLMITCYDASTDPEGAERLLQSIDPAARPESLTSVRMLVDARTSSRVARGKVAPIVYLSSRADTPVTFNPRRHTRTLLAFTGQQEERDSIIDALREFYGSRPRGTEVLDMRLDQDTLQWRRTVNSDSVAWPAAWVAGSVAAPGVDRLGIPTLPFFIVTDSTGTQIYRGTSVAAAVRMARSGR